MLARLEEYEMTNSRREPTVIEGTPEEIAAVVNRLPVDRYHAEITCVTGMSPTKDYLAEAIQRATSRTAAEIQAAREEIFAQSPEPTPIPPGKTLDDMVMGKWPGDESDEEIRAALEELS